MQQLFTLKLNENVTHVFARDNKLDLKKVQDWSQTLTIFQIRSQNVTRIAAALVRPR